MELKQCIAWHRLGIVVYRVHVSKNSWMYAATFSKFHCSSTVGAHGTHLATESQIADDFPRRFSTG
jgi:hypothetical protein